MSVASIRTRASHSGWPRRFEHLRHQHRDGVRLFPGGAAGAPHAQLARPRLQQGGEQVPAQPFPGFPVAEELGDVDGERIQQPVEFLRLLIQQRHVVGVAVHPAGAHPHRDPAAEAAVLVGADIEAGASGDPFRQGGEPGLVGGGHALASRVSRLARASW